MTRRGSATAAVVALTVLLLVSGCSGSGGGSGPPSGATPTPSPTSSTGNRAACAAVSTRLVAAVQAYIDTFGPSVGTPAGPSPAPSPSPSPSGGAEGGLQQALAATKTDLQQHGCDLDQFRSGFAAGMNTVRARGAVARAVLLRLTASLGGSLGSQPVTRTVRPSQDLEQVLSHLAGGSVVRLTAGDYRLKRPLVLLAGITLRGQGAGRTRITGRSGGSVLLALTDGKVELDRVTVRHVGRATASVLVGGPTSEVVLTSVRITGARGGKGGQSGGSGITMTAAPGSTARRSTTLQVTRSDLVGNTGAGILLSGGHRASIRSSRFAGNGQCGVCFAGESSGAVRGSLFDGNSVGVAVLDAARPLVDQDSFLDGLVGVQVSGSAEPDVRRSMITGASRAAMIFGGTSSGRVDGNTCSKVPYGIVVSPKSAPLLGSNACSLARGR